MQKAGPSQTARKVALNIITLGAKPGMDEILPAAIVDATARLLVESGAAGATGVRWSRSRKMVTVYKAFDWMMPGQFEAFLAAERVPHALAQTHYEVQGVELAPGEPGLYDRPSNGPRLLVSIVGKGR